MTEERPENRSIFLWIENVKAKKLDFNDPKIQEIVARIHKQQVEILARKNVDRQKLECMYITI